MSTTISVSMLPLLEEHWVHCIVFRRLLKAAVSWVARRLTGSEFQAAGPA